MLRTSPFLVIYAWFLLISAYIYSMDLTEEELPSVVKNINLAQIGFVKVTVLPCKPLLVKCLYTMMFWITLRQFMQERQEAKQSSALADMVAPLQVTVGTATGDVYLIFYFSLIACIYSFVLFHLMLPSNPFKLRLYK